MKNLKKNSGITLIALIITIIILLILAVVTIMAVNGDGIISKAKQAKADYQNAQTEEQGILDKYLAEMEGLVGNNITDGSGDGIEIDITYAQTDDMLSKTENTTVYDAYGNKIVIPAGFKILVDETTGYTSEDINVTKGIVVTDGINQFVWVPVGTIYTNTEKTEYKTINLSRYTFAEDGTPTDQGDAVIDSYYQELSESTSYRNVPAKDIEGFKTSANNNGGYYFGRYEAGVVNYDAYNIITSNSSNETNWTGYVAEEGKKIQLVCKSGEQVWNYVTQNKASEFARNMYNSSQFTSDLVNSYAWDTAIVFIQEFSGDRDYSQQTRLQTTLAKTGEATDGTNKDVRCNIYDMAGNYNEWTTEYSSDSKYGGAFYYPCVARTTVSQRTNYGVVYGDNYNSYRALVYLLR